MNPAVPARIGDVEIGPVAYGAWNLSRVPVPDETRAIATVHAALDAGIRLVDTADAYCPYDEMGHNERLVARAIRSWPGDRDAVVLATKGGSTRAPDGAWGVDGRPAHIRAACDASLRALGVEAIDLYQHHRPDPTVPYAETIGAFAELLALGKVRHVGISNVTVAQIDEARAIVPLAAVQNELSPAFRSSVGEARHCADLGIPFLAWGPLGGRERAGSALSTSLASTATALGTTPQAVALAWVRAQAATVVPVVGATRPETIRASVGAASLDLGALLAAV